jgi:ABC-type multidrug transport system fused ATPase/permease subunit
MDKYRTLLSRYFKPYLRQFAWSGALLLAGVALRHWSIAAAVGVLSFGSTWVLFAIGSALSLGLGAYLYLHGLVSIGTVFLIFRYADLLNQPLESLTRQSQDMQQAGASAIRVLDLRAGAAHGGSAYVRA